MASLDEGPSESARLAKALEEETDRVQELRASVQQWEYKVGRATFTTAHTALHACVRMALRSLTLSLPSQVEQVRVTHETLESNVMRLYDTAKARLAEENGALLEARRAAAAVT